MSKPKKPTSKSSSTQIPQRIHRQSIDVGPLMSQVSPVGYWWKHGHFDSEEKARGAFELAYQQAMDGMGRSVTEWMGITEEELNLWIREKRLPKLSKKILERMVNPPKEAGH